MGICRYENFKQGVLHRSKPNLLTRYGHKFIIMEHNTSVRQPLNYQLWLIPSYIPQAPQQPQCTKHEKRARSFLIGHHESRSKAAICLCHHLGLPTSTSAYGTHGNTCRIFQFGNGETVAVTAYGVCGNHIVGHFHKNLLQCLIHILGYHVFCSAIAVNACTQRTKHKKAEHYV